MPDLGVKRTLGDPKLLGCLAHRPVRLFQDPLDVHGLELFHAELPEVIELYF